MLNEEELENYFFIQHSKKQTSDNTLSSLKLLDKKQIIEIINNKKNEKHLNEKKKLLKFYSKMFPLWLEQLHNKFNLLLYGYGSKQKLIRKFAIQSGIYKYPAIMVYGFVPSVSIKHLMNLITQNILLHEETFDSISDQCKFIEKSFTSNPPFFNSKLYIIIHNIDGSSFRYSSQAQSILSIIASLPNIHMIASIENINSAQLWDNTLKNRFNWIWYLVPTFEHYIEEIKYEEQIMIGKNNEIAMNGLRYILNSLTPNARGIFKVLALFQLQNPKKSLSYKKYYELCREKFLVNNELTMKSQLNEFRDHKVIIGKNEKDGLHFFIPIGPSLLQQIIEEFKDNE